QAEVENHPESNVITRAVGIGEELYVDLNVFNVQLGDAYLLCSDGLYNTVSSDEISAQLKNAAPDEGVNNLVHMALENGAPDNVSVIIIKGMQETSENLSAQQQI
ncbi:MAG: hypothetical protein OEZ33_10890, partial [Gammaproteobacteria bacterium]|nr:hypothetical protein [Gammaproteobacteria bacterium]